MADIMADNHESVANGSKSTDPEMSNVGFQAHVHMGVQPPKKEDLQTSYASTVASDVNPAGWYGSMSTFLPSSIILCRIARHVSTMRRHPPPPIALAFAHATAVCAKPRDVMC